MTRVQKTVYHRFNSRAIKVWIGHCVICWTNPVLLLTLPWCFGNILSCEAVFLGEHLSVFEIVDWTCAVRRYPDDVHESFVLVVNRKLKDERLIRRETSANRNTHKRKLNSRSIRATIWKPVRGIHMCRAIRIARILDGGDILSRMSWM